MDLRVVALIMGSIILTVFAVGIWWDFRKEKNSIRRMEERLDKFQIEPKDTN